jgi:hypothetical protein
MDSNQKAVAQLVLALVFEQVQLVEASVGCGMGRARGQGFDEIETLRRRLRLDIAAGRRPPPAALPLPHPRAHQLPHPAKPGHPPEGRRSVGP